MNLENGSAFYFPRVDVPLNVTVNAPSRGFSACARQWMCGMHPETPQWAWRWTQTIRGHILGSHVCPALRLRMCSSTAYAVAFVHTSVQPRENRVSQYFSGCSIASSWPDVCFPGFGLENISLCLCFVFMNQLVLPAVHTSGLWSRKMKLIDSQPLTVLSTGGSRPIPLHAFWASRGKAVSLVV